MNPQQTYLGSLQKNKPSYGGLFASTPVSPSLKKPTPTPNMSVAPQQSSAPASTAPVSTTITPPKDSSTNVNSGTAGSAKSTYVSTLTGTNGGGSPVVPPYMQPGYKSPGQIADEKVAVGGGNPVVGSNPSTGGSTDTGKKSYIDSYRDYLSQYAASLKPSDELTAAKSKLADAQSKIDERDLKARREYEAALNKEGGLKAGNEASARSIERQNASELADLALIEKGAAANVSALDSSGKSNAEGLKNLLDLSKPIQIGDKYIDPYTGETVSDKSKDPFSLSEGQTRYEYDPATGGYKATAHVAKTTAGGITTSGGTYVAGANPTVDAWANRIQSGQSKITDIPAASGLRNAVTVALDAMGNSPDGKPTTTELGKEALANAKDILKKFESGGGYNNAVGGSAILNGLALPGTQRSDFKIAFQALKDQLSLDAVKYLKGQGQVSDAERALLASAVTKLNLSQSEGEFKTTLKAVIDKLQGNSSSSAGVLTSPDGTQEVDVASLTPEELKEAQASGWK